MRIVGVPPETRNGLSLIICVRFKRAVTRTLSLPAHARKLGYHAVKFAQALHPHSFRSDLDESDLFKVFWIEITRHSQSPWPTA